MTRKTAEVAASEGTTNNVAPASNPTTTGTTPIRQHRKTKASVVLALLARPRGATMDELVKATGWQKHSVRGFLAGTVKKKLGRELATETGDKGRIYRLVPEAE